jgi:peroxiredoxin
MEETDAERRLLIKALAALPLAFSGCGDSAVPAGQRGLLPSGALDRLDGGQVELGLSSGPCLINFWATWCRPCRAEMASLNRLFNDFRPKGLGVFAISVDEDIHLVREFILQLPLSFPILLDPEGKRARRDYGIIGFPTTFLVARNAMVKDVWVGERNWDASAVRVACEALCQL